MKYFQQQQPDKRLALLWDRAMYHCSAEIKTFLESVNRDLIPERWRISAPNGPSQNYAEADARLHVPDWAVGVELTVGELFG